MLSCTGETVPHRPPTVPAFTCSCPAVAPCTVSTKPRAAHSLSVSVATRAHALFTRWSLFTEALLAPAPIQNQCVTGSRWVSSRGFWGSGKRFRRPARSPHAEGCGKLEWQERGRHRQHFPPWSQDHLWGRRSGEKGCSLRTVRAPSVLGRLELSTQDNMGWETSKTQK